MQDRDAGGNSRNIDAGLGQAHSEVFEKAFGIRYAATIRHQPADDGALLRAAANWRIKRHMFSPSLCRDRRQSAAEPEGNPLRGSIARGLHGRSARCLPNETRGDRRRKTEHRNSPRVRRTHSEARKGGFVSVNSTWVGFPTNSFDKFAHRSRTAPTGASERPQPSASVSFTVAERSGGVRPEQTVGGPTWRPLP